MKPQERAPGTCRDVEWETIRWPSEIGKMLFHPSPERPTEPNAGILRLDPGAHHPIHNHEFAQVWYILSGEFKIDDNLYKPGTMIFHPDPHFEGNFETVTGGTSLSCNTRDRRLAEGRSMPDASTWKSAATFPRNAPMSDAGTHRGVI